MREDVLQRICELESIDKVVNAELNVSICRGRHPVRVVVERRG
jgi:hypothetical protein